MSDASARYDEFVKKLNIDSSTSEGAAILKQLEETKVFLRNQNWPFNLLSVGRTNQGLHWSIGSYHGEDPTVRGSGFGTFTGEALSNNLLGGGAFSLTVAAVDSNSGSNRREATLVLRDRQGSSMGTFTGLGEQNSLDNPKAFTGRWF